MEMQHSIIFARNIENTGYDLVKFFKSYFSSNYTKET